MSKFNPKDIVIIPSRHKGGEIIRVHPDGLSYDVRLTTLDPFTGKVEDHIEVFGEEELVPAPKRKGVIIV